jgi:multiple sugar transport system substrate-binding protein
LFSLMPQHVERKKRKNMSSHFKPKLSRRKFLKYAGTATAASLLAACAPQTPGTPDVGPTAAATSVPTPSQPVTVRWWANPLPAYSGPHLDARIAQFEATHPGIKIAHEPFPSDGHTKFLVEAVAGNAPDIILSGASSFNRLWKAGAGLDLRPFLSDLPSNIVNEWPSTFIPWLTAPDGAVYGLPMRLIHIAMYYNKSLFDEVGVDYPDASWNHDDYMEAMRPFKLEQDGRVVRWGGAETVKNQQVLENKLRIFDGALVDPTDDRRSALHEPNSLEALRWIEQAIWAENVWPQTAQIENHFNPPFENGQVAMLTIGSWRLGLTYTGVDGRFDWDFSPYPRGPRGTRVAYGGGDNWFVYGGTKHPEATWEVLKWLVSDEMEIHMMESAGSEPSRPSLYPRWYEIIRSTYPGLAQANLEVFQEPLTEGYSYFPALFSDQATVNEVLNPALEQFIDLGTIQADDFVDVSQRLTQALQG